MYRKAIKLLFLDSSEKIEVNRYPNRRKSPHITCSRWRQSGDEISAFLPIWGITKGLLRESAETRMMAKYTARAQATKNIGIY